MVLLTLDLQLLTVAGNVDFNGDLDVDGTTNLDVVDIGGAVTVTGNLINFNTGAGNAPYIQHTGNQTRHTGWYRVNKIPQQRRQSIYSHYS